MTVVICLAVRYAEVIYLVIICIIKEFCQAIGGLILLRHGQKIQGAKWFGKVSTSTFYGVMILIVGWPDMPRWLFVFLVVIVALLMLFAFFKYITVYFNIRKNITQSKVQTADNSKTA